MVENVERSIQVLQSENSKLRNLIETQLGNKGRAELRRIDLFTNQGANDSEYTTDETASEGEGPHKEKVKDSSENLVLAKPSKETQLLADEDYSLMVALKRGRQNFLVTDPRLPDNPIVFASAGFMTLTGYSHEEVLGRNCRFLQGPDTDPVDVERIRDAVAKGEELSVCLLNYKKVRPRRASLLFPLPSALPASLVAADLVRFRAMPCVRMAPPSGTSFSLRRCATPPGKL